MNLNRSNTTWTLDPRVDIGKVFGKDGTPRGVGNQVSAEFNLVYRWHSATSKRDEEWTEKMYKEIFGKEAGDISMQELLSGLGEWEHNLPEDPVERQFAHLKRGADLKYNDDDLVKIMTESIEDTAGKSTIPLWLPVYASICPPKGLMTSRTRGVRRQQRPQSPSCRGDSGHATSSKMELRVSQ